jgi:SAM-dependent methyltransferase
MNQNVDARTVRDFGSEWATYDQSSVDAAELRAAFDRYFHVFPWAQLRADAEGFDLGCGSGRWARFVAPRVGRLHCVDASEQALEVARRNLAGQSECVFHHASVDAIPLLDESMDFGYSLGVLHHVPDTAEGIRACVARLKPGAPFLLYLYYALENRPLWFRALWRASDVLRRALARLPHSAKVAITTVIATACYWPLARAAGLLERAGKDVSGLPLSAYRRHSLYTMRTDALDRFGTRLEQRFTRSEIAEMMDHAGLEGVKFSALEPYWCAVGTKRYREYQAPAGNV